MNTAIQLLDENKDNHLPNIAASKGLDVYRSFTSFEPLPASLKDQASTTTVFLKTLLEKRHYLDALQFIAHGLTKHEAIAWAHHSLHSLNETDNQDTNTSLTLHEVEVWLADPTPEKCLPFGDHADTFDDPLTWLRLAIFWNGPNISAHQEVSVQPSPQLTGHGVSTALILGAVGNKYKSIAECHTLFLDLGIKRALGLLPRVDVKENY